MGFAIDKLGQWTEGPEFKVDAERTKAYAKATNDPIAAEVRGDGVVRRLGVRLGALRVYLELGTLRPLPQLVDREPHGVLLFGGTGDRDRSGTDPGRSGAAAQPGRG